MLVEWWWEVIIESAVSALSLSLRDEERFRDWEIERAWQLLTFHELLDKTTSKLFQEAKTSLRKLILAEIINKLKMFRKFCLKPYQTNVFSKNVDLRQSDVRVAMDFIVVQHQGHWCREKSKYKRELKEKY